MTIPKPLIVNPDCLEVINGRAFPERTEYLRFKSVSPLAQALRECLIFGPGLVVPAIAQAAVVEANAHRKVASLESFYYTLQELTFTLRAARPESRPINFAVERIATLVRTIMERHADQALSVKILTDYADMITRTIEEDDRRIAKLIADEAPAHARMMVIGGCGMMSSVGIGTGVAGLIAANNAGKDIKAVAPYCAPLFSGPKLTAYELRNAGIDCEIIADTAIASSLLLEKFDAVIVIANRLMANGDVSCPSGSTAAALAAKHMGVPFYVITYDHIVDTSCPSMAACPLEEFNTSETLPALLSNARRYVNDMVAAEWVTGYITTDGVYRPKTNGPAANLADRLNRKISKRLTDFLARFE